MTVKSKRHKFRQWYQDLVTRNIVVQQIVRAALILFLTGFLWFGFLAIKQAGLNSYFSITGSAEYTIGDVLKTTYSRSITGVTVSYKTYYLEQCFIPGYNIWTTQKIGRGAQVGVLYNRENPAIATCQTPMQYTVLLYFLGGVGFVIGSVGIFFLLFKENSDVYRRLIGIRPISKVSKKV